MFQTFLTAYDLLSVNGIPMNCASMCIHTSTCSQIFVLMKHPVRGIKAQYTNLYDILCNINYNTNHAFRWVYTMFQLFLDVRTSKGTIIYFTHTIAVHQWHVSRRHGNTTSFIHYADMQFLGLLLKERTSERFFPTDRCIIGYRNRPNISQNL